MKQGPGLCIVLCQTNGDLFNLIFSNWNIGNTCLTNDGLYVCEASKLKIITPARAARSAARRAFNDRVPRARARQPRFGSSMQYCIRSLISITIVQTYCQRAKVCASLLLWHFKTIWIENICLPFIEVHCSNQQKLFHFAHRGFSYFLISTQNFNKWRPNLGVNILVLTSA